MAGAHFFASICWQRLEGRQEDPYLYQYLPGSGQHIVFYLAVLQAPLGRIACARKVMYSFCRNRALHASENRASGARARGQCRKLLPAEVETWEAQPRGGGPLTVIAYPIPEANTLSGLSVPSSEIAAHRAHLARCGAARWPASAASSPSRRGPGRRSTRAGV